MAARPGKRAQVRVSGGAVGFVTEACTETVAHTTYQISNAVKNVWDRAVAISVFKDAVLQAANLYKLNRLNGTITFLADIGAAHVITVTGSYLPLTAVIEGKTFMHEVTRQNLAVAKFGDVFIPRIENLHDAKGNIGQWKTTDETMSSFILAGVPVVVEFNSDTTQASPYDRRMWALLTKDAINAVLTSAVEQSVEFDGSPDVDGNVAV